MTSKGQSQFELRSWRDDGSAKGQAGNGWRDCRRDSPFEPRTRNWTSIFPASILICVEQVSTRSVAEQITDFVALTDPFIRTKSPTRGSILTPSPRNSLTAGQLRNWNASDRTTDELARSALVAYARKPPHPRVTISASARYSGARDCGRVSQWSQCQFRWA